MNMNKHHNALFQSVLHEGGGGSKYGNVLVAANDFLIRVIFGPSFLFR